MTNKHVHMLLHAGLVYGIAVGLFVLGDIFSFY